MTSSLPAQTTTTHAYSITLPSPFQSSPYRFIVQHTTIGPSTSLLYASIGTVTTSLHGDNDQTDAYQDALKDAEGGPDDSRSDERVDPSSSSSTRVDIRPGSKRLAADWACSFPSRSVGPLPSSY